MTDQNDDYEDDWISKSEVKRQMDALQSLGTSLIELNKKQRATIPMSELLAEAIDEYDRLKHKEAKRRMMQRIGKLMRDEDSEAIQHAYELTQPGSEANVRREKQLESWRARLIDRGDQAVFQLIEEFPLVDRQQMRNLVRNAQKSAAKQPEAPYSTNDAKKLFKALRDYLIDQETL